MDRGGGRRREARRDDEREDARRDAKDEKRGRARATRHGVWRGVASRAFPETRPAVVVVFGVDTSERFTDGRPLL